MFACRIRQQLFKWRRKSRACHREGWKLQAVAEEESPVTAVAWVLSQRGLQRRRSCGPVVHWVGGQQPVNNIAYSQHS